MYYADQRVPAHSAWAKAALRSLPECGIKLHESNLKLSEGHEQGYRETGVNIMASMITMVDPVSWYMFSWAASIPMGLVQDAYQAHCSPSVSSIQRYLVTKRFIDA